MKPFVKWVGGKKQLSEEINKYIEASLNGITNYRYIEPFCGGGAIFFGLKPQRAIINDLNSDLMNAYNIIRSDKYLDLIELLKDLSKQYANNSEDTFYTLRAYDREPNWTDRLDSVTRAARMIFLNKTCYNGLYRVNSKGQFNTPIGRYKNPIICDEENIKEIHDYLSSDKNDIEIMNVSYEEIIAKAKDGDILYIDPPYDYENGKGFTSYQMMGFTFDDFEKLKIACDKAVNKGAFVIISNNATSKVIELFKKDPCFEIFYDDNYVNTLRSINSNGSKRKTGHEVLMWGMQSVIPFPQANDIGKIIRLAMADEEILQDKEKALALLNVGSERQVAYYLSALRFFKFINQDKKNTARLKEIKHDENLVKQEMYNTLINDDMFNHIFNKFLENRTVDIDYTIGYLKGISNNLSETTIERRTSTIKKWVEWMYELKN